ncbi:carboxypeptidase M32 [Ferruginibacter sp. HRS2-29]|uniref:carboxypeptidase M32 n=1 Tax=Ferruginibacter sp. HRS2-29 TaxID=2487334 RepID=UPI0020CF5E2B|nr:carboxypeptidase M32 [Ferruginibacter sp. HRS2-29]MCP9750251.1 carboxypeptidase M32 [Ferruginibacter sp. HRS2-29]
MSSVLYDQYKQLLHKIADVKYASAVLQWDQETYLPPKGNDKRGQQIATLSELAHEQFTSEHTENLLQQLVLQEMPANEKRNVELSLEDYNKSRKLPATFVRKMSEAVNRSFHAWIQARKENSFAVFEKPLNDIIELKKQEADLLGFAAHPYDALMNDYDKGLTVKKVDGLFGSLKPQLSSLLQDIATKEQVDDSFLFQHFDKQAQWDFGIEILKKMQFDFEAGRQDLSEHPFTTSFNNHDVRLTTRVDENDFSNMLWSCIHEGGHGLYEQGLPENEYGLPLGEYCSLSIHESQSRLWENCIGRGIAFWEHNYPSLQKVFPQQLSNITLQQFYKAINKVQPSLIRTEADELTYHFHVMIRYEIEKGLIEGSILTRDIPAVWNELYKQYLGVEVPDDRRGCLQDVHWSHGSFGYFATYSIGSLYAAQLYAAIAGQNPSLEKEVAAGDNGTIVNWLKQHIYRHGRYYLSDELCRLATGQTLDAGAFISYATKKYSLIYDTGKR